MKIYQVGGSVRDMLLGQTPHDIDYVVTGASVQQMLQLGYKQVGKQFPVFINTQTGDEYALARKEVKTGPSHTDFEFIFGPDVTLAEDLERRDFTCNALAFDQQNNQIIDYFDGKTAIKNKILHHINANHFIEDPLRVLRMCRFAAQLDFTPADQTLELTRHMVNEGMLQYLTTERIWQEILRSLQSTSFEKFLLTARQCGALKVILPEVDLLFDQTEKTTIASEDNLASQTICRLKQAASKNAKIKFAILLCDTAKHLASSSLYNNQDCANYESNLIRNLCCRLKVPSEFKDFALLCCHNQNKFDLIQPIKTETLVDLINDLTKKHKSDLEDFLLFCQTKFLATKQQYFSNLELIRQSAKILQKIKATDMPDFAQLSNDKNFYTHYRAYKIEKLQHQLNKLCL